MASDPLLPRISNPPTIALPGAFHIGTLDPSKKCRDSQEGRLLSVSLHPAAWRMVGRGVVSGATHAMCRADGAPLRFLNAHAVRSTAYRAIEQWALAAGLADRREVFEVSGADEEGRRTSILFLDHAEALFEKADDPELYLQRATRVVHTEELGRYHGHRKLEPLETRSLLLIEFAQSTGLFDGVWWADELDPWAYSAPRGGIFPERVTDLLIAEIDPALETDIEEPLDFDFTELRSERAGAEAQVQFS